MPRVLTGIHHVTALCGDPQRAIDFYAGTLGLRFVKKTVNFDAPQVYHLYFGDAEGTPGSIITFFAWPDAARGRRGAGQLTSIAFAAPHGSLPFWKRRLETHGIAVVGEEERFGEMLLRLLDPDGLEIEIVASDHAAAHPVWPVGPIPTEVAIRQLSGVTATLSSVDAAADFYEAVLGFRERARDGRRWRFVTGHGGAGALLDIVAAPEAPRGRIAVGQIHHVAWRTPSDEEALAWREQLLAAGHAVTPILDRQYFRSIYFHEPGGVLFEIATDLPGFARDEPLEQLGTRLMLPPWLEPYRAQIEEALPPVQLPVVR
ncbi:MAG: ring-cleaving dioxygenase [Chloroflexota bacterium]|nr:ring-cleaving dioxygenase [Dehalococcoidia bacterium]MDW8255074.1 ring-cleaving dioxygenase [Chloroflexota bacterium]